MYKEWTSWLVYGEIRCLEKERRNKTHFNLDTRLCNSNNTVASTRQSTTVGNTYHNNGHVWLCAHSVLCVMNPLILSILFLCMVSLVHRTLSEY